MSETEIEKLISHLARLPGLGPRSARRATLHLLTKGKNMMEPLAQEMLKLSKSIKTCETCQNIDITSPCHICSSNSRDRSTICVIEDIADLWALERNNNIYKGLYFVLGGTLSAMDGMGPEQLGIEKLVERIKNEEIQEVIIATNATIEGQTTAHYITERLEGLGGGENGVKVTRLAHGIPVGGELDYLDEGTIHAALSARKAM